IEPILEYIDSGKPFFGICLGLQVLFEESEESPEEKGLGVIKGKVVRFPRSKESGLKVPQMGWNKVKSETNSEILEGIPQNSWFYFVHSYYVAPEDENIELLKSYYGIEFTAGILKDNIFASQFHPEKSADLGLRLLKNFSGLCSRN
ncbi:MAG: imidazole glycerol phosphate synthase subunit HisH, partial [Thermodesulfobacteriota bacterium]